jgi:hypothetical protein
MGIDRSVSFAARPIPPWSAVAELLAQRGFPAEMRMIDGELAFPDESPPDDWKELRVGTPQGMVTARRGEGRLTFVTWGNADEPLRQAWNALAWAFAQAGGGEVETEEGRVDAETFRRSAEMPAPLS